MFITKNVENGYNEYINLEKDDHGTMMDVALLVLEKGMSFTLNETIKEVACVLFEGQVDFIFNGKTCTAKRCNTFKDEGSCMHIPKGVLLKIEARERSEVYLQKTVNQKSFEPHFYAPEEVDVVHAGSKGELMGCMQREIKTYFDYESAPWSNMVLGEVLNYPGKWSSYPPHHHPQPEVYFHRFDYPQGFGVSYANGEIYKSVHNGLTVINHSFHSQGTAPGYAMMYTWGIRHIDGNPWQKTRIDDKEHSWLWESDANDHIFKES